MYEQLLNLDPVKINFSKAGMDMINIVLAFVMYGVALGIKPSLFKEVFKSPNRRFWRHMSDGASACTHISSCNHT